MLVPEVGGTLCFLWHLLTLNMASNKLYRYAATIIFAASEGYCYPVTRAIGPLIDERSATGELSQHQRLTQLYPHVMQRHHDKWVHQKGVDVLFVQRTTEAGFMPDSHVFPGGVLDEADCSNDWLELFPADTRHSMINSITQRTSDDRLSLYSSVPTNSIIGELAFRICAIREAFEETGILIARPLSQLNQSPCYQSLQLLVDQWRGRVCDDANNFVQMFREIKCVPDVWSLVEWSNWLTPENIPRRYDTVFYLCCLEGKPSPIFNPSEVSKAEWIHADEALRAHRQQHITLPPPQVSELSIINMFPNLQHLHLYALYKSIYNSRSCILPRRISFDFTSGEDAIVYSPLPGDDLYPVETSSNKYQCSSEAMRRVVTLTKADNMLYEFTATATSRSDLVSNKMIRMSFEDLPKASYMDNVRPADINNIVSDINTLVNGKL